LESMTSEQFDRLSEFVNTAPAIKQDVTFKCTSCKKKNTHELRGIDDFF
jgi:ribosomal protein L44E